MNERDPPVQFRMSHALTIATTATRVTMLMWMMGGILTLVGITLTVLLMGGRG